jgi:hypothetical protein
VSLKIIKNNNCQLGDCQNKIKRDRKTRKKSKRRVDFGAQSLGEQNQLFALGIGLNEKNCARVLKARYVRQESQVASAFAFAAVAEEGPLPPPEAPEAASIPSAFAPHPLQAQIRRFPCGGTILKNLPSNLF